MVGALRRVTYLVVLVAVLATLLVHPVSREEDRWALAVLIGLDVREIAATSGVLWRSGQRLLWRPGGRQRRTVKKKGVKGKPPPKVKMGQGDKLDSFLRCHPRQTIQSRNQDI